MDFSEATFVMNNDVLFRCSRHFSENAEPFNVKWQIVVPDSLKNAVISLAHEGLMSSHMGFYKTFCKINSLFYWIGMRKDIRRFIRSCHVCQVVKRPHEKIPKAPLINISSVGEPFQEVVVDAVGPLPRTKRGYQTFYRLLIVLQGILKPSLFVISKQILLLMSCWIIFRNLDYQL